MNPTQQNEKTDYGNGKTRWPEGARPSIPPVHLNRIDPKAPSQPPVVPTPQKPRGLGQRYVEHLRESKLVQWLFTYLAVAWLTLQLVQTLGEIWPIPLSFQRGVSVALGFSLLPAGVIAWYHGERGRQSVCPLEVMMVGTLLVLMGTAVWQICVV